MKFLILASCVVMAMAAPQTNTAKDAAYVAASPFVAAARATHQAGHAAANAASKTVSKRAVASDAEAPIVRSESDVRADGFSYSYETGNGITADATGTLKQIGNEQGVAIQGSYGYPAPDGTLAKFTYIADENGFQPQGDLIPVAPEIPPAIAASLKYIAEHPYQEPK